MEAFWNQVQTFFWNIFNRPGFTDYIDILIVAVLLYQLVMLTRETRAIQVLKGLAVLLVVSWISELLGLTALNWILRTILNNGALVLIILFQPEIRKALEQLGRGAKIDKFQDDSEENERIISEITQCLTRLSKRRVGALTV